MKDVKATVTIPSCANCIAVLLVVGLGVWLVYLVWRANR